ncbi:MAG: TauD/TfdA family dioxygenase [Alphaproteobacteria bacterium]|nr:TauD/TfdA family dioxygenase [Alphaproteobacteria bacterium]
MTMQVTDIPEVAPDPGRKETFKGLELIRHDPCGAEILNVDLRKPLADDVFEAIMEVWHRSRVIVFRDQKLEPEDQLRFGRRVGELSVIHTEEFAGEDPAIMYISNVKEDGEFVHALPIGEMMFHIDQCYTATPAKATILYAIEIPETGGNTLFADMIAAYDALDDDTKARIEGLKALNVYDYDAGATHTAAEVSEDAPRYAHPIARTHPVTGQKALFVNRLMTRAIEGLAEDESRALLAKLFDHQENPAFVYEHRWRLGDLLMWDNRCTLHARRDFNPQETRLMRRLTVLGETPV